MRFKCFVQQPQSLIRMLTSLSHMAKDCLIVLSKQTWKFMINEKFVQSSHPQCYASLPIRYVFSHYMIESKANNHILLHINMKNLLAALKSVKEFNAQMTCLKLTKKKQIATLSFEMWNDHGNELRLDLIQDVAVRVVQHSKLFLYEEPQLGAYHASSNFPPLKSIKTVIERMRVINSSVSREKANLFINNENGKFLLQYQNEHCSVKTFFLKLGLDNKALHDQQDSIQREREHVRACVDLKFLLKVIQALAPLQTQQIVIAITKKTCVTIHARLADHLQEEEEKGLFDDVEDDEDVNSARVTFYLCVYIDDESEDEEEEDEEEADDDEEEDDGNQEDMNEGDDDQDMQDADD
eukprot:CAMPEP_0197035704 /NCGR_PEP_ID=MMETSP1384-20130603/13426_1 /TAXON_ID=29189 /ORGANISM="Ammonia sp." /LENGTH=352 /DNA_ID=CAMNT_0042465797 /DNA_START=8 /DNA_END=1066 /DNA_ORIENTATION=+